MKTADAVLDDALKDAGFEGVTAWHLRAVLCVQSRGYSKKRMLWLMSDLAFATFDDLQEAANLENTRWIVQRQRMYEHQRSALAAGEAMMRTWQAPAIMPRPFGALMTQTLIDEEAKVNAFTRCAYMFDSTCGERIYDGHRFCHQHRDRKCAGCGAEAVRECEAPVENDPYACPSPLCKTCRHVTRERDGELWHEHYEAGQQVLGEVVPEKEPLIGADGDPAIVFDPRRCASCGKVGCLPQNHAGWDPTRDPV